MSSYFGRVVHGLRIVFLDIDGVLINRDSNRMPRVLSPMGSIPAAHPECVAALNRITDVTGAALVMSSSWREEGDLDLLTAILTAWGVSGALIGKTPVIHAKWNGNTLLPGSTRGDEIQSWLETTQEVVGTVVILDDASDMVHLRHRLVQTDPDAGLTHRDADRVIAMFSQTAASTVTAP